MTDLQSDYFSMFTVVEAMLKKNQLIWQGNPIVSANFALLQAYLQDIQSISGKRGSIKHTKRGGLTKATNALREKITSVAYRVKEALKIYYGINNMENDERLFSYAKSKLVRMTQSDFYVAISGIIDRATPLQPQLAPLGVTPQIIASLTQDATKYYNFIFQKEEEEELQKGLTASLAAKINECRLMLRRKMDSIIGTMEISEKDFCELYRISRKLRRSGGRRNYYSVIISGKITDAVTKLPLAGVNITPETKGKPAVSDDMGKYTVKMYKKDAKALLLKLEGYEDLRYALPDEVKEHKMKVDLKLNPLN